MRLEDIQILSTLEAVRKRPTMYVGDLENPAVPNELAKQALCHALDEAASGRCTHLWIRIKPDYITVKYDAAMSLQVRGGVTDAEAMLTQIGACHNLKENMEVGDDYCTLGLAVLTAFSASMTVFTGDDQDYRTFVYAKGVKVDTMSPYPLYGTSIGFNLDPDLLGENVTFDVDYLKAHLRRISAAFPNLMIEVY